MSEDMTKCASCAHVECGYICVALCEDMSHWNKSEKAERISKLEAENKKLKIELKASLKEQMSEIEKHYDVDDYPEEVPSQYWWADSQLKELVVESGTNNKKPTPEKQ